MKKLIFFVVLLCSTLAQLCAQTCNTCQGGIIAQCPTGVSQLVGVCYNAGKSFLTLTPYLVGFPTISG